MNECYIREEFDLVNLESELERCLECGGILVPDGGCKFCRECGASKCL